MGCPYRIANWVLRQAPRVHEEFVEVLDALLRRTQEPGTRQLARSPIVAALTAERACQPRVPDRPPELEGLLRYGSNAATRSDGEGAADIAECVMLFVPKNADTDGDSTSDGGDPLPQLANSQATDPHTSALAVVSNKLFDFQMASHKDKYSVLLSLALRPAPSTS